MVSNTIDRKVVRVRFPLRAPLSNRAFLPGLNPFLGMRVARRRNPGTRSDRTDGVGRFASACAALAIVLAGCASSARHVDASGLPTNRPVLRSDLTGFSESRLRYPGSHLVMAVGADQSPTRPGEEPNPAYVGGIYTVRATAAQLYQWFQVELSHDGFSPAADFRPSTETSGQAWQRFRRLQVQVGVLDPQRLRADQGVELTLPQGAIAYEELLVGYPPGLPKV